MRKEILEAARSMKLEPAYKDVPIEAILTAMQRGGELVAAHAKLLVAETADRIERRRQRNLNG